MDKTLNVHSCCTKAALTNEHKAGAAIRPLSSFHKGFACQAGMKRGPPNFVATAIDVAPQPAPACCNSTPAVRGRHTGCAQQVGCMHHDVRKLGPSRCQENACIMMSGKCIAMSKNAAHNKVTKPMSKHVNICQQTQRANSCANSGYKNEVRKSDRMRSADL